MKTPSNEIERLRFALNCLSADGAQTSVQGTASQNCCEVSEIWQAVGGEVPAARVRQIVDHLAECPLCAESWRLARQIRAESGLRVSEGGSRRQSWSASRTWAALAAAALIVLTAGLSVWKLSQPNPSPVVRGVEQSVIEFPAGEDISLPRERFRLSWSLPEPDPSVHYNVHVLTLQLQPVADAYGLEAAEFTVPAQDLVELPSGTRLVWRVEAVYPDGRRIASQTLAVLK